VDNKTQEPRPAKPRLCGQCGFEGAECEFAKGRNLCLACKRGRSAAYRERRLERKREVLRQRFALVRWMDSLSALQRRELHQEIGKAIERGDKLLGARDEGRLSA
jgi:hypothetical protein